MKLAETRYDNHETGCCAPINISDWDRKEMVWDRKPFYKDHIRAFLHIPLNFGSVMGRDQAAVEKAEAYPEMPFWMTDEVSPWGADIFMALDREMPGRTEWISGTFWTRVFEGPYRHIGRWIQDMEHDVESQGRKIEKMFFYYPTCPKCAKKLGHNHVVLLAQVH